MLKFLWTGFYKFKTNRSVGHSESLHVSDDSCYKWQDVPAHSHDQPLSRWWYFCCLSTNGNFSFLEKWGIHFLSKMFTASIYIDPHPLPVPHPVKSSFCTGIQFPCDLIRRFNNRKKWENRWLWTGSRFIYFTLFTLNWHRKKSIVTKYYKIKITFYKNVYGGQSSEGFPVDHHILLNKQRNDTELNRDVVENTWRA